MSSGSVPSCSCPLAIGTLALAALTFPLSGCGSSQPLNPVPVKGKVMFQGKPLANVLVQFNPEDIKQRRAEAPTGPDGTFSLSCVPGKCRVTILPLGKPPPPPTIEKGKPQADLSPSEVSADIPEKYKDPATTPFKLEVPEQGKEGIELTIEEDNS
jgi:hypothetical protein